MVARFPGLGAGTGFVAGGLRLVRGRRPGQSRFLGNSDFHGRPGPRQPPGRCVLDGSQVHGLAFLGDGRGVSAEFICGGAGGGRCGAEREERPGGGEMQTI